MNLGKILKTEVDCALISNRNYDSDNGFFANNVDGFEKSLIARKYNPCLLYTSDAADEL